MRSLFAFAFITSLLLAGCAEPTKPSAEICDMDCASSAAPQTGALGGTVTDLEARPLGEIMVTLHGAGSPASTSTDGLGLFGFTGLAPGEYQVEFTHADYGTTTVTHQVQSAKTTDASIALDLLPNRRPRAETFFLEGHYDCGIEAVILTGDCLVIWKNATGQEDPATTESNTFEFNITERWTNVFIEATWTAGTDQMDGLHVYLAPANESREASAHHTKYAVAEGGDSPLTILLQAGIPHELADVWPGSDVKAQVPAVGGEVLGLVYPRGKMSNEAGQVCDPNTPDRCFLGVGVALDLEIFAYVTVFYNQPMPEGFSAMPKA